MRSLDRAAMVGDGRHRERDGGADPPRPVAKRPPVPSGGGGAGRGRRGAGERGALGLRGPRGLALGWRYLLFTSSNMMN